MFRLGSSYPEQHRGLWPSEASRVVGNMIINALEATPTGGSLTIGSRVKDGYIEFWVHNIGYLTREMQSQIFQRSYSTKAANRGLGTYSMKLLSSFLHGKVNFSSSKKDGITFSVLIPLSGPK